MFSVAKRWLRVLNSSPARSKERGDDALVSLAIATALVGEIILCGIIILRISYTEIDWLAYIQEVNGFLEGERNYYNLGGDTGPLVYPAGFVYAYSLLLGAPFLLQHPVAYLARSFELGRVFKFKWTVNFKFLSEEIFVSPVLSVVLLALTVATLALFAIKWIRSCPPPLATFDRRVGKIRGDDESSEVDGVRISRQLPPEYMVKTLFVSNFIGVVFCRSLHYQFYSWYYHTLPFLLWQTNYPVVVRLAVLVGMEFAFNVFPATPASSVLLQVCHVVLLVGLWTAPVALTRSSSSKYDGKGQ